MDKKSTTPLVDQIAVVQEKLGKELLAREDLLLLALKEIAGTTTYEEQNYGL